MKSLVVFCAAAGVMIVSPVPTAQSPRAHPLIELWAKGQPAFGVFVPNERVPPAGSPRPAPLYTRAGGEKLAANALYDFVFLNLEGRYDAGAVRAMAEGLRQGAPDRRPALIVRIPPFHADPAAARTRVREVVAAGGDGVTFPHVETLEEARQILAIFREERIDVWSPSTPGGTTIVMLMLEDPEAVAQAAQFADLAGYSVLACGIGSLTQALGGDRAAGEAGTQKVLAETKRAGLVNMLTATPADVEQRVEEGFLGILTQGPNADEAIRLGRAAAKRSQAPF